MAFLMSGTFYKIQWQLGPFPPLQCPGLTMIKQKLSFSNHDFDDKQEFAKPKHHCNLFNYG